jgi:hypothetical protein
VSIFKLQPGRAGGEKQRKKSPDVPSGNLKKAEKKII